MKIFFAQCMRNADALFSVVSLERFSFLVTKFWFLNDIKRCIGKKNWLGLFSSGNARLGMFQQGQLLSIEYVIKR